MLIIAGADHSEKSESAQEKFYPRKRKPKCARESESAQEKFEVRERNYFDKKITNF